MMLGITVADSVLVGTLVLAVLAAWQGKRDGAVAAKAPPEAKGLEDLAGAVRDMTEVLRGIRRFLGDIAERQP